jgi:signal transduction histidine kinase
MDGSGQVTFRRFVVERSARLLRVRSLFRGYRLASVPPALDVGIAVAVAVLVVMGTVVVAGLQVGVRPLDAVGVALAALAAFALAWRRRAPIVVLGVVVTSVGTYLLIGYPYGPAQLCMVLAMFEVARQRGLRTSLTACVVAVVVTAAAVVPRALLPAEVPVLLLTVWASWLIIPWSVGALVQVRSAAVRRARGELAAKAAWEERIRVAKEVHDAAGHGFAAVVMQAGVALLVFDEQPEQARRSLEAIRSTGVDALAELRTMLDTFHQWSWPDPELPAGAAPGMPGIASLVDHVRAAGLPVELSVDVPAVPEETGRVAYRIVQEALTNALRHAGPTTAVVRVQREQDTLVVEVLDRGAGVEEVRPARGLAGMRERVTAVGGELTVESRPGGGFRVSARLPMVEVTG